jgi:tRNA threonylcarbamoyladenosine biosynthesis protein TsaE
MTSGSEPARPASIAAIRTSGPAETEAVGARLAAELRPGDVVLLSGELGSGKTTLVRGACRALGVTGPVTSPSFTIGSRYTTGRLPITHVDLYRLQDLAGEDPSLMDDYADERTVTFVEWPAVAEPALERVRFRVRLEHAGGDERRIEIG